MSFGFGANFILKAVNSRKDKDGNELFEFEDSAAEFSKDGKTILVDVNRVEPGKIPHEVFHLTMKPTELRNKHLNVFACQVNHWDPLLASYHSY